MVRLRRLVHGKVQGLLAQYYRISRDGKRDLVRETVDSRIDFYWKSLPFRGLRLDSMYVVWRGLLRPNYTGDYELILDVQGGVRLAVGGRVLIDELEGNVEAKYIARGLKLVAGVYYPVQVEFVSKNSNPHIRLSWIRCDGLEEIVPLDCLYTYTSYIVTLKNIPDGHRVELWSIGKIGEGIGKRGTAEIKLPETPPPFEAYFRIVDLKSGKVEETPFVKDIWGGDVYEVISESS